MIRPRPIRHRGADRSRRAGRKPKRRYEHGARGPEKKRKKRRKSTKKRRKLRFTIRYDRPGQTRRGRRRRRSSLGRVRRLPCAPVRLAVAPPVVTPEIAELTAAISARIHRAIAPKPPLVPRVLTPKAPTMAPVVRTVQPKPPVDLAARTVRRSILKVSS